jgi:heterodisulfide reductase subunit B
MSMAAPEEKPKANPKYLLFLGCAIPYRVSSYEIATRKVLNQLGVELVEMPE